MFLELNDIVLTSIELCILSQKPMSPEGILLNCGVGGAVL